MKIKSANSIRMLLSTGNRLFFKDGGKNFLSNKKKKEQKIKPDFIGQPCFSIKTILKSQRAH